MIERVSLLIKNNIFKISIILSIFILYTSFCIFIYYFFNVNKQSYENASNNISASIIDVENKISEEKEEYIYIDIKGEVKKPNVYKVLKNSRTIDVIDKAGGLTKNANTRFINLSKILNDGEVIVVYSNAEIKKAEKEKIIYVDTPCVCEEIKNDSCYNENSSSQNNNNVSNMININSASLGELMTLSGIGESKAKAIIKYREENGKFISVEDIIKVNGISETIYSKIKNNITI